MTGPDRIWAFDYDLQDNDGTWRNWQCWSEDHPKPLNASEYIRRDPAVLAALPEVQALIAAVRQDYNELVSAVSGNPSGTKCDSCRSCGMIHCADAFYGCPGMRCYTPAEAIAALAARDRAMMAKGLRDAAEVAFCVTPYKRVRGEAGYSDLMCARSDGTWQNRKETQAAILARATEIEREGK